MEACALLAVVTILAVGMDQRDNWHLTDLLHAEKGKADPFAAAVRSTRMPMAITDPAQLDNPIVFVNEAFQLLTGYSREECIGRNCRFLQGPNTDPIAVAKVGEAIAKGEDIAIDLLNYKKNGTTFWNALYLSPARGEDGTVQFFFASQLDVTERVEAQRRIANQKEQVDHEVRVRTADLEASLEAQSLLLHEVDHRVKNNLSVIGSLLRMQIRETEEPIVRRALRSTMERVDAMAAIHRRLYQADDVRYFELSSFVSNLIQDAVSASAYDTLTIVSSIQRTVLPSEQATSAGLLINEVLLHLFDSYLPLSAVKVSCHSDGTTITITVGNRLSSKTPQHELSPTSAKLITRLASQLKAHVTWNCSLDDMSATIRIPVSNNHAET